MINIWSVLVSNDVDTIDLVRQDKEDAMMLAQDIIKTNKTHKVQVVNYKMKDNIRSWKYYSPKGELEGTKKI